jgi:rhamnogalacturonyl hydrolase YesR
LEYIEPNKHYTGNHDLGFMMYNSYGNAYRLAPGQIDKDVIFTAAESLSKRYISTAKVTQSWGDYVKRKDVPVIIDNMLNLELLLWVAQEGGNPTYREMAINHANTTLNNHFRPDYSSYHVVSYDRETGKVLQKRTAQGYADSSAWSRGQGWALYGYTMMYRFTRDQRYLTQAKGIANFILNHPNLPKDKIPYWDFDAPDIPNAVRDASAGALIASALLELGQYVGKKEQKNYVKNAAVMLESLSGPVYRPELGTTGGFLLLHSTGALPLKSEIDVPIIYADYYYLEALKRYKDWYL